MNQKNIRTILRRVAFIAFIASAVLAVAALLLAGICMFTSKGVAIAAESVSTIIALITIPVYLFLFVTLACAVMSLAWPFESFRGHPTVEARYDELQDRLATRIYPADLLAPFEKHDFYLRLWRISAAAVCGVSAFASLVYLYTRSNHLLTLTEVFYGDVVELLLPAACYTCAGMIFCLAARLVLNRHFEKGIGYSGRVLKKPAPARQVSSITTMHEWNMQQMTSKQKVVSVLSQIALYTFLIIMAIIVIFPFYWMIISSLKSLAEYKLSVPTLFPKEIIWGNYLKAFEEASLLNLFKNTVIVGVVSTILSLVITIITAFAFARLEFKGKNALFAALLGTMMIPGELFTITNYITVDKFDWVNNDHWFAGYSVLIVPFLVSVFYIYLLKQNFMQIPNELYLAAKVDGTSDFKYLCKVMIPLSLPTLISITILKMMGAWNSYVWPRLVAHKDFWLITNGLRSAFTDAGSGEADIPVQMAAVTIVSIPLFLVFIFLRKYIMKGVSRSGIKG